MTTVIKIDTRSKMAQQFLEYVRTLPFAKVEQQTEKSPYNPEFVKKIKKAEKQKGRVVTSGKSLWDSLG